jgi:hypothetical protein
VHFDGARSRSAAADGVLGDLTRRPRAACSRLPGSRVVGLRVTFERDGRASATLDRRLALEGGESAGCVAMIFGAGRVPAFAGAPVTLPRSVDLE